MLTFTMKVNEKEVIAELEEHTSIRLSPSTLKRLINKNTEVLAHLSKDGIDTTSGREMLMDAVAKDLGVQYSWPTYADKNFEAFHKKLRKAVKKASGYRWMQS